MKRAIVIVLTACMSVFVHAQEHTVSLFRIDARADYQRTYVDKDADSERSGFTGKNLNLMLGGDISDRFSYFWRQKLNKTSLDAGFFNATDRLYLDYKIDDKLTFRAGKQTIAIGGYEYDKSTIDLYFYSEYFSNISCYAWGASLLYDPSDCDNLLFQAGESMFNQFYDRHFDLYNYNVLWCGSHGPWGALWSVNLMEWAKNRYITHIAIGNQFSFSDRLRLKIDYINRATAHQTFFFSDCSLIGELCFQPTQRLNLFAKTTYDVNRNTEGDLLVRPGTEITSLGGGLEYFPLGDERVRLHANYSYAFGTNANTNGLLCDRLSAFDMGVTWRVNIINRK
ncbi:MAG: porin [Prevotella sp.]|nr:porin [Prevotella sp.]